MANEVAFYILISCFGAISLLHLYFCFAEKEGPRRLSKCLCLALLLSAFACGFPAYWLIAVGLGFGLLGDYFLINKHREWSLVAGIFAFLANHFCFIAFMIISSGLADVLCYAIPLGVLLVGVTIYPIALKIVKKWGLSIGVAVYTATLLGELAMTILLAVEHSGSWYLLAMAGSLSFIASDATLGFTLFVKDVKRRDFYIMLTYLLGQALLCSGMALGMLI